ncbi:MAG: segregation/condensation protein A [bacterium]|nr:segregation/condensation protein A [bacterium]
MDYTLKINDFEGPLDLLLHLIKEAKMSVFDFSVDEIVKSYFDYINKMQQFNLTIASSYLVMASELIEIKSKMLLPRHEEEENEEDPKENLVNRLIEYQKYKQLTDTFKQLEFERAQVYTKIPENLSEYIETSDLKNTNITLDDLLDAFSKFLDRKKENIVLETKVTKKEITVEERRKTIKNIIIKKGRINFFDLFDILNKEYVVVTFLAILEMVRKNEINIIQENNFEDIICEVS